MQSRFFVIALFAAAFAAYLWGNVTNPVLCYDPAQMIFTVLGLTNTSPPFSEPGTFLDAWRLNLSRNMDPGGFTFLLRYWALISTNHVWLRLLSVLFLGLGVFILYRLGVLLLRDRYLAGLLALFPLTNPVIAEWSLFPRAYGMEVCGVAWVSYLCYRPGLLRSRSGVFLSIAALSFFATSRYSFLLTLSAFVFAFGISTAGQRRFSLRMLFLLCLPFVPILIPLFYHLPENRDYISQFILSGKTLMETRDILRVNFGVPEALFQCIFFLAYAAQRGLGALKGRHRIFFWFLVLLNLSFIPVSMAGYYPWYLTQRFTIAVNIASYISLIPSVAILLPLLRKSAGRPRLGILGFLMAAAALLSSISMFRFDPYSDTLSVIQEAEREGRLSEKGYFSPAVYAEAKYLFEYGILKGHQSYADKKIVTGLWIVDKKIADEVDYAVISRADAGALALFEEHPAFVREKKRFYHLEYFVRKQGGLPGRP
ncbi:MAG: hypothetical protein A2X94_01765 [Bdellovibrionales bacterium GWB1_55_8]|nr:MAG: hypothetical protein A2X94_01765 [Bdellovibrionales bacterium GWB1_55_8]